MSEETERICWEHKENPRENTQNVETSRETYKRKENEKLEYVEKKSQMSPNLSQALVIFQKI